MVMPKHTDEQVYKKRVSEYFSRRELEVIKKQQQYRDEKMNEIKRLHQMDLAMAQGNEYHIEEAEKKRKEKVKRMEEKLRHIKREEEDRLKADKIKCDLHGLQYVLNQYGEGVAVAVAEDGNYLTDSDMLKTWKTVGGFVLIGIALIVV